MIVPPPTEDSPQRSQRTGVTIPNRDGLDLTEWKIDIHRGSRIETIRLIELAPWMFTPTLDTAAVGERACMVPPSINAHHARIQPVHGHRIRGRAYLAVAQLPICIIAPAEDATNLGQDAGVTGARRHGADGIWKIDLGRAVAIGGCSVAKLPLDIVTPAKEIPAYGQRAGMIVPSGKGDDRFVEIDNIHREETIDVVAVSQLPRLIVPPTLEAVIVHQACMGRAKGKDHPVCWGWRLPRGPYVRCQLREQIYDDHRYQCKQ